MKKLVIFDLDGTLINSIDDLADSTNYALAQCDLPLHTVAEYKYFVGNAVDMQIRRALPKADQDNQVLFQQVKDLYLPYYALHSRDKTAPYDGITSLLQQCAEMGILIAVVSNKPHAITNDVVNYFFPKISFATIIGQKDGIPKKPDPAGVNEVLKITGISRADTLYVGDTWVDMETAKNSGVESCGVLWGFRLRDELEEHGATFIAENTAELFRIISK